MIKTFLCNKRENAVNVHQNVYFTWELSAGSVQLGFKLRVEEVGKTICSYERACADSYFYLPAIDWKPLTRYDV